MLVFVPSESVRSVRKFMAICDQGMGNGSRLPAGRLRGTLAYVHLAQDDTKSLTSLFIEECFLGDFGFSPQDSLKHISLSILRTWMIRHHKVRSGDE